MYRLIVFIGKCRKCSRFDLMTLRVMSDRVLKCYTVGTKRGTFWSTNERALLVCKTFWCKYCECFELWCFTLQSGSLFPIPVTCSVYHQGAKMEPVNRRGLEFSHLHVYWRAECYTAVWQLQNLLWQIPFSLRADRGNSSSLLFLVIMFE